MKTMFNSRPSTPKSRAAALHDELLEKSIHPPLKYALDYFQKYVANGGQIKHPELGNLDEFVANIDLNWDATKGVNQVAEYLKATFDMRSSLDDRLDFSLLGAGF